MTAEDTVSAKSDDAEAASSGEPGNPDVASVSAVEAVDQPALVDVELEDLHC